MKEATRHLSEKHFAIVAVIFFIGALWIGRGFIRDTVAKEYANLAYGRHLETVFNSELDPVNNQAGVQLGLRFSKVKGKACETAYFESFHETVNCGVTNTATSEETPALLAGWKKNFPAFDAYLLANGWKSVPNTYNNVPPNEVFDRGYSAGIAYTKQIGKNDCSMDLIYLNLPNDPGVINTLTMREDCSRPVKFFGGSDSLYSGGWTRVF